MDIALVVTLVVIIGIPILLPISWLLWSCFVEPRLEEKWERESHEEFEELWNTYMVKKQ